MLKIFGSYVPSADELNTEDLMDDEQQTLLGNEKDQGPSKKHMSKTQKKQKMNIDDEQT